VCVEHGEAVVRADWLMMTRPAALRHVDGMRERTHNDPSESVLVARRPVVSVKRASSAAAGPIAGLLYAAAMRNASSCVTVGRSYGVGGNNETVPSTTTPLAGSTVGTGYLGRGETERHTVEPRTRTGCGADRRGLATVAVVVDVTGGADCRCEVVHPPVTATTSPSSMKHDRCAADRTNGKNAYCTRGRRNTSADRQMWRRPRGGF